LSVVGVIAQETEKPNILINYASSRKVEAENAQQMLTKIKGFYPVIRELPEGATHTEKARIWYFREENKERASQISRVIRPIERAFPFIREQEIETEFGYEFMIFLYAAKKPLVKIDFTETRREDSEKIFNLLTAKGFDVSTENIPEGTRKESENIIKYHRELDRKVAEIIAADVKQTLSESKMPRQGEISYMGNPPDFEIVLLKKTDAPVKLGKVVIYHSAGKSDEAEKAKKTLEENGYEVQLANAGNFNKPLYRKLLYAPTGTKEEAVKIGNLLKSVEPLTTEARKTAQGSSWNYSVILYDLAEITLDWNTNAHWANVRPYDKRYPNFPNNSAKTFYCPPNPAKEEVGSVDGTDVYYYASAICPAAVHAGRITFASGGFVTVEAMEGKDFPNVVGSTRNGIKSESVNGVFWSYKFID
jgi:hypothetical protein